MNVINENVANPQYMLSIDMIFIQYDIQNVYVRLWHTRVYVYVHFIFF